MAPKKDKPKGKDTKIQKIDGKAVNPSPTVVPTTITLKILEIHYVPNDGRENSIDVTFKNQNLKGEGDITFSDCYCRPDACPVSEWSITFKTVDEKTIMDISSNPLVLTITKMGMPQIEDDEIFPPKIPKDKQNVASLSEIAVQCCIELIDLVSDEQKTIKTQSTAYPPEKPLGQHIRTYPHMPFIVYSLTTSRPLLEKDTSDPDDTKPVELRTVSITTEFIMHPTQEMFEENCEFEIKMFIPIKFGMTMEVSFKRGYKTKFSEIPKLKIRYSLPNVSGDAQFTQVSTSGLLNFNDLVFNGECNLPGHLVRNYSQLICCEEMFRFKQTIPIIKYMMDECIILVQVICTKGSRMLHYEGHANFKPLSYVGSKRSRQAIPLKPIIFESPAKKPTTGKVGKNSDRSSPKAAKPQKNDKSKGKVKDITSDKEELEDVFEVRNLYAVCEDGYNTCLIIEIEIDKPLIEFNETAMCTDEMRVADNAVFIESGLLMLDYREAQTIFRNSVLSFADKIMGTGLTCKKKRKDRKGKKNETEMIPTSEIGAMADEELFGSAALMIANKFHFNQSMDEDDLEITLRNAFILLVNQSNDILDDSNDPKLSPEELTKFRIQCAEECRELGYLNAKDFYIMNIKDTSWSAESLLNYAVFNIRAGDTPKALECTMQALKKDPTIYDSYLLQAYIFFTQRDRDKCKSLLQLVTKICSKYLEAWVILHLVYLDSDEGSEIEFSRQELEAARLYSYTGPLHRLESIVWQTDFSTDPFLKSIFNFTIWGCLEFAEFALAHSLCRLGNNSYKYLINKALVNYERGLYLECLDNIKLINTSCTCKSQKIERLKAHCFLNLNNSAIMSLIPKLPANYCENKVYTERCNLMNLKLGKYLLSVNKFKAGRFYLKQCSKKTGTYASLMELGNASMKCSGMEVALKCFKLAHKIDPYDWYPWSQLAFTYFRLKLFDHYYICAKNARENQITDETVSRELDKIDGILNNQQE